MASRKTIKIESAIDMLESMIKSTNDVKVKAALCTAIENILHESNAYGGFMYTFWTFAAMEKYQHVDDAINAGLGTEYDRQYMIR